MSTKLTFAAIDPFVEDNIIKNVQKEIKGQEFIQYGTKNIYPQYLHDLYENVPELKSIINGLADFGGGKNITLNIQGFGMELNKDGDTIEDIARQIFIDLNIYGGFALNILRNAYGNVAAIYNMDFRSIRSDKKNTKFFYAENWADRSAGRVKAVAYPAFRADGKDASSIFYYKNDKYNTYPTPIWGGAADSAECLKHIGEFHLNSLYNGLSADYIVSMNNGVPEDSIKEEVEDFFNSKFSGFQNGGRTMISWNNSRANETTIQAIPNNNFIDRYNALEKSSKQEIFTAFRCHPALFGLPTENSGFNSQDIQESWKVANKTIILPMQKIVKRAFEKIFGVEDAITIEPLEIDWSDDKKENEEAVE